MKPRSAVILALVAALVLFAGWRLGPGSLPPSQTSQATGALVFPNLAPKLQQAARVEITHQGKTLVIEKRPDGVWGLADRGGFPVQVDKLRGMLTGLTELRLAEPRTADPAEYHVLGVGDPKEATSTASLLKVLDKSGHVIAELITGHRRMRTEGNVPEAIYVRRPGEKQSWLAEGTLEVDADPQLWMVRDIANIAKARVQAVTVTRGDTVLEFARVDGKPALTSPAEHPKLDDYKLSDVFDSLDGLSLIDARPAGQPVGDLLGTARIQAKDGLVVVVTVFKSGKQIWIRLAATGEGAAGAEAAALNKRTAGWSFQVGEWKEAAFVPRLADLAAPPPDKPAAAPAPTPPAPTPPAAPAAPAKP